MKLRNKQTGKIERMWKDSICLAFGDRNKVYHSLAELNAEWEDYKPAEPLIKDEKIRKAIRAWAEANGDDGKTWLKYCYDDNRLSTDADCIEFEDFTPLRKLKDGEAYTIDELCGVEVPEPLEPSFIDLDERIRGKELSNEK